MKSVSGVPATRSRAPDDQRPAERLGTGRGWRLAAIAHRRPGRHLRRLRCPQSSVWAGTSSELLKVARAPAPAPSLASNRCGTNAGTLRAATSSATIGQRYPGETAGGSGVTAATAEGIHGQLHDWGSCLGDTPSAPEPRVRGTPMPRTRMGPTPRKVPAPSSRRAQTTTRGTWTTAPRPPSDYADRVGFLDRIPLPPRRAT